MQVTQATAGPVMRSRWVQSPAWLRAFLGAVLLCLAVGLVHAWTAEFRPGNYWGLAYGISAAVLLAAVSAYSMRRRAPRRGPAAARNWLQFHIYGGALFLLLVLMHSAFALPNGVLTWILWILSLWMVISGILGCVVQRWIPRMLTSGLATEVHYDRIPELVKAVRRKAQSLAEKAEAPIQAFYRESLSPRMQQPLTRLIFFIDITGGIQPLIRQSDHLRAFLDENGKQSLDRLIDLFKAKTDLDAHYTLQKALRWWLYGHVPLSLILIGLVLVHIVSVLYY